MSLSAFHPAVRGWFVRALGEETPPQRDGWPHLFAGESTLIAAPTGSGKTLAAFLSALDALVRDGLAGSLGDETRILYVSPLKALGNDIKRNLEAPLAGIGDELERLGLPRVEIRTMVRSADTPSKDRARMTAHPPHVVVTTPESLYILLTSEGGRRLLRSVRTVIVDEIHALVADKRGSHLSLSLERLDALAGRIVQRIGLSATQRPIERVARFLVGRDEAGAPRPCAIVDSGHVRPRDVAIELPGSPLEAVMSGEVWEEIYDRIAELVRAHRTTLVFVNTRRMAERVTRRLGERLGDGRVMSHHGSLAREQRFDAEQRLKSGDLSALVATASLELGIDVGSVDLVCQVGSTRSIAAFLQRVGRAGHQLRGVSKGRLFPLSRDELVSSLALLDAVRRAELDAVSVRDAPLDILAQQIVAAAASEGWTEEGLYSLVRRADPYADLSRKDFEAVVGMLADGFSTRRGRRGARLHWDAVNHEIRGRKGARLIAITSGGAIPDNADYDVVLDPTGQRVGSINEDFAMESMAGDIFQLGNASWRILRVTPGTVRVEDARGQPPTLPFWLGEAPGRTRELSHAVSRLRCAVDEHLGPTFPGDLEGTIKWLSSDLAVPEEAARQAVSYLAAGRAALSAMPSEDTLVLERFFDESGGMQLVVHSPLGSRVNRAWGLALRKRFCQKFDFELQAAATDDAIVLSLGPTHSFPLDEVFQYLRVATARELLVQAVLLAPMFTTRWRWNATRALAVLRFRGGKRVPPKLQRMEAEDLAAVVFPDQVACQDNLPGQREVPDQPLVRQTITDCLVEAMDIDAFETLLRDIAGGKKRLVARDTTEPSPFAHEILSARPYAYLDDAPIEERRTQAVHARRFLDPTVASDLGALDASAILRVKTEAWPTPTDADELSEALSLLGFATSREGEAAGWASLFAALRASHRAAVVTLPGGTSVWVAVERLAEVRVAFGVERSEPEIPLLVARGAAVPSDPDAAFVELLRGRLEAEGPVTVSGLMAETGLPGSRLEAALATLEAEGFVLRGRFTPGVSGLEWCERRLLARIHRYTIGRLQSEIEPVTQADYVRFLLSWQRVQPDSRMRGPDAVAAVLAQLEGFEVPARAWESEILPSRIVDYQPSWLDALCLSGRYVWLRRSPPGPRPSRSTGPVRGTPIAIVSRASAGAFRALREPGDAAGLGAAATRVRGHLESSGASFFDDIVHGTRLLRTDVESALAELAASGWVTSDSFAGLRALVLPEKLRSRPSGRRRSAGEILRMESAGRWSLLSEASTEPLAAEDVETVARTLLRRWGVVFRKVLERETGLPPFRDLLRVYRRLEARGDIRGGRFVAGPSGEQYALPEAVSALRSVRRAEKDGELVSVSAADPVNVIGVVTPGDRVPAIASNRALYRDGVPIARKVGKNVEILGSPPPGKGERWALETALVRGGARVRSGPGRDALV